MAASETSDETGLTPVGRLNKFLVLHSGRLRSRLEDVRRTRAWQGGERAWTRFNELSFVSRTRRNWHQFWRQVSRYMPKRLYARSLIIIITPMILLQSVIAFVFMERHWQTVTQRLSEAVVRD